MIALLVFITYLNAKRRFRRNVYRHLYSRVTVNVISINIHACHKSFENCFYTFRAIINANPISARFKRCAQGSAATCKTIKNYVTRVG